MLVERMSHRATSTSLVHVIVAVDLFYVVAYSLSLTYSSLPLLHKSPHSMPELPNPLAGDIRLQPFCRVGLSCVAAAGASSDDNGANG